MWKSWKSLFFVKIIYYLVNYKYKFNNICNLYNLLLSLNVIFFNNINFVAMIGNTVTYLTRDHIIRQQSNGILLLPMSMLTLSIVFLYWTSIQWFLIDLHTYIFLTLCNDYTPTIITWFLGFWSKINSWLRLYSSIIRS